MSLSCANDKQYIRHGGIKTLSYGDKNIQDVQEAVGSFRSG